MIDVQGLTYAYPKTDGPAIRRLGFHIEPGEIFGFLGPNGAGKSTTQKILIGLLRGYDGEVSVFGRPLADWDSSYYERVGVSFEFPNHYLKLTARENLTYFRSLYGGNTHEPEQLLEMVGLKNDGEMQVSQYSKGMKNRLSIARSLLNDPELVFMDEPTSGLDPVSARNIKRLILEQKENGKTIFLTTHDMVVADELCDRVAFIVDGEIALIDAPRTLKLDHGQSSVRVEYVNDRTVVVREFPLEGLAANDDFQKILQENKIQTLHSQEATLEQVFIRVTGRGLA